MKLIKILLRSPSQNNYMIEWISSSFLKQNNYFDLTTLESAFFLPCLRSGWTIRKCIFISPEQNTPQSFSTPRASLNIYLTNKLPNLELCLLVLKAFMARISELIRKKWERASHGGRIQFRLSSWQEYVFKNVVSRPNIQLKFLERLLDFPLQ